MEPVDKPATPPSICRWWQKAVTGIVLKSLNAVFERRAGDLVNRPFIYITGALSVLTGATLLWSIFGSLKMESTGLGFIVRGKHFVTVSSKQQGVVAKQFYELDQDVKIGDILMSLDTEGNQLQLDSSIKTLKIAEPLSALSNSAGKQAEVVAKSNINGAQLIYQRNAATLRNLITKQEQAYAGVQKLYAINQASSDELASSYSSLLDLKQQLLGFENDIRQQRINFQQLVQSNAQANLNLASQNISTASSVAASKLVVDQSRLIRSPIDGTVISYDVPLGGYANPGDPLMTLVPKKGPLRAALLVGSDQFERVKIGDRVLLSPSASPSIRFGFIKGTVISKADAPATSAELLRAFGSNEVVQSLMQSFGSGGQVNLPYLVDVSVEENDSQPVWTLGRQPPWGVRPGSIATARIISDQVRPISLLLPFFRGL